MKTLKLEIIDNAEDFNRFVILFKHLMIEMTVQDDPAYCHLSRLSQLKIIEEKNQGDLFFTNEEAATLLAMHKMVFDNEGGENIFRIYVLKDDDEIVAFQTGEVLVEERGIIGHRELAYTLPSYAYREYNIISSTSESQRGRASVVLYTMIKKWFREINVRYEGISVYKRAFRNIELYINFLEFIPINLTSSGVLNLEKDYNNPLNKTTLKRIYDKYCENIERTEIKTLRTIMAEINSDELLNRLSDEQKSGLAKAFLREEEKTIKSLTGRPASRILKKIRYQFSN